MKVSISKLVALSFLMAAVFGGNVIYAEGNGKVQRCWAKLHSCYPGQKLEDVFVYTPFVPSDCQDFCSLTSGNENACDFSECSSRCEVAFGISEPPCE